MHKDRSAIAGAVASAFTSPLDMVKLRLQVRHSDGSQPEYKGMLDGLYKVYAKEGLSGLFRGATARVLFHTPSAALTMALFETCRNWWLAVIPK